MVSKGFRRLYIIELGFIRVLLCFLKEVFLEVAKGCFRNKYIIFPARQGDSKAKNDKKHHPMCARPASVGPKAFSIGRTTKNEKLLPKA